MDAFAAARENMVKSQILTNKVKDKNIIKEMCELPRQDFVQDNLKLLAYSDEALNLNDNRYILPPMVFAKMAESAEISESDSVLDIGCGTGYSSTILSKLAKKVIALENDSEFMARLNHNVTKHAAQKVQIVSGKLSHGWAEGGPYNVIFVNGAILKTPNNLLDQLSEGGRLVVVINNSPVSGAAILFVKNGDKIVKKELFDVSLPILNSF